MFDILLRMLRPGPATSGGGDLVMSVGRRAGEIGGIKTVRFLNKRDVVDYRDLRLQALKQSPTAFGSSYEAEVGMRVKRFAAKLRHRGEPDDGVLGVFAGEARLVGILDFTRDRRQKRRHIATLGGLYVAPEFRGQGCGGTLLDAAIAHARRLEGMRRILLAVTADNVHASSLYTSRGFKSFGLEMDAIFVEGRYYDMEHMALDLQNGD